MFNLVNEAEAEYATIWGEQQQTRVINLYTGYFDFLTSKETETLPLHVIEKRRVEEQQRGAEDQKLTVSDFIKYLDVKDSEIKECVSSLSALHPDDVTSAYFGNQDEEVYRFLRNHLIQCIEDVEWFKREVFLGKETAVEYERQRWIDGNAPFTSNGEPLTPETFYKQEFFAKIVKNATD